MMTGYDIETLKEIKSLTNPLIIISGGCETLNIKNAFSSSASAILHSLFIGSVKV